jgi:hypothetical protein
MRAFLGFSVLALLQMSIVALADDVGEISRRIAQKVQQDFEQAGSPFEEMLAATGLSAEDSERVAKEFVAAILSCVLDAAASEAEAQSLPYEEVLLAIEQALDDPEIEEPTIIDGERVNERAQSCGLDAMQKAGISEALIYRHNLESALEASQ